MFSGHGTKSSVEARGYERMRFWRGAFGIQQTTWCPL